MTADLDAAVAAYGLEATQATFPSEVLADGEWSALMSAARSQRITGLLVSAAADGALLATDEQYQEAADAHFEDMGLVLRLERLLTDVAELLRGAGIEVRVLKGSAVAHRLYPDPCLRSFADVDLLVRADAFDAAVATIVGGGGIRQFPQPRPGFDRRFSKGTSFSMPGGMEVDLHRTFVSGPFGLTVRLDDLWEGSWPFEVGGVALAGLDLETCFLHLCYHAALGDARPRLVTLRDIAQVLYTQALDVDRVRELSRRWKADAAVARALSEVRSTLDLAGDQPLAEWVACYRPDRAQERALSAYTREGPVYGYQAWRSVHAIPGVTAKAAYLRALVFPDSAYVDGRYRNRWDRWGRSLRIVRQSRRQG